MEPLRTTRFAHARARQALHAAGLPDDDSLLRAPSTRNEVFLGQKHVIRVNQQPNQRLRREALLCKRLPAESWSPRVVAYGGRRGADFLIVKRLPGGPLGRYWPDMTLAQRRSAIEQLCAALKVVHAIRTPVELPRVENLPYLIDPRCLTPLVPMYEALATLRKVGIDSGIINAAESIVTQTGDSLTDYDQRHLIHGDLTFENLLWDGSTLTGVLDFEWCRGAPVDMELDVLLRMSAFPFAHVAPDYEHRTLAKDYACIPEALKEFLPSMFEHPQLFNRLRLYSMAYDLFGILADPPTHSTRDLAPLHPLNRLRGLLTDGGYLARLLAPLGVKS